MTDRTFVLLNDGWNAEPNAPEPEVQVTDSEVTLQFLLNDGPPYGFEPRPDGRGSLTFSGCSEWRLGSTNDEGWYRGQCRYSGIAPAWGEFYEIVGPDPLAHLPTDWKTTNRANAGARHFLFYLRDETFECFADEWSFSRSG